MVLSKDLYHCIVTSAYERGLLGLKDIETFKKGIRFSESKYQNIVQRVVGKAMDNKISR